jgi:hypothetical protein
MVKGLADAQSAQQVYLVLHDYGMGGRWWWIRASSAAEITDAFAEVEVVSDPEAIARARTQGFNELDIEDAKPGSLPISMRRDSASRRIRRSAGSSARPTSTCECLTMRGRTLSG